MLCCEVGYDCACGPKEEAACGGDSFAEALRGESYGCGGCVRSAGFVMESGLLGFRSTPRASESDGKDRLGACGATSLASRPSCVLPFGSGK